ncbi:DICT sensory domain-containing protein [Halorussus marinus]|uniref:DICT sensory domain-containing protein n=1 Tax=Halorussus marinus TaxID=2505976 RepID=UPI00106E8DDF|nr:DICT sensory domain-containing protein [Halorussus marinus]
MTISTIVDDVTGSSQTLTVYDPSDPNAVSQIADYFEVQNVTVEEAETADGPEGFAVLHDEGEFLAAADVEELQAAVTLDSGVLDATGFDEIAYPDLIGAVDDKTFTAYGKRRMILASREVEERSWYARGGELHSGFQRLSLLAEQWDLYTRIADRGVDVHVYGEPDWEPPANDSITVHASDDAEIRDAWFVAFESPEPDGDCALVADEREPNVFCGFWTFDDGVVADVFDHLREEYGRRRVSN